jgi:uncharacterized protein (UPF0248 family)
MNKSFDSIPLVRKENIHLLTFPTEEVLKDKDAIEKRVAALHHATSLGNLSQHKVDILFEDQEGVKRVKTTIWAIANRKIFLKDHRSIPIHRIHGVSIS